MQIIQQYYYRRGKVMAKAIIYTFISVALIAFAIFVFAHWELSFMFSDWKGWLMIIVYALMTLGMVLSAVYDFGKASRATKGIPALIVANDRFVLYDQDGTSCDISYSEVDSLRVKSDYTYQQGTRQFHLIITYRDTLNNGNRRRVSLNLNELDRHRDEIETACRRALAAAQHSTSML